MNKTLIIPIVALVALFSQRFLHVSWSNEELQTVNDGILALTVLIGIFMHPTKKK